MKNEILKIRLSSEEKQKLKELAAHYGLNLSTFIRMKIIENYFKYEDHNANRS